MFHEDLFMMTSVVTSSEEIRGGHGRQEVGGQELRGFRLNGEPGWARILKKNSTLFPVKYPDFDCIIVHRTVTKRGLLPSESVLIFCWLSKRCSLLESK